MYTVPDLLKFLFQTEVTSTHDKINAIYIVYMNFLVVIVKQ